MPSPYPGGREELGQNFLVDRSVIATITGLVARTHGPLVELAAGDGALTLPLSRSGRPLTAVEIDPVRVRRLRRRTPGHVTVVHDDLLRVRFPRTPHVLVCNVPFHLTTPVIKRLLAARHWHNAVLLVQWEVARRRAGVGGASLLTARWWPWYRFDLHRRVPARAFRPVPSVDAGLLTLTRRDRPLVDDRAGYQRFVGDVFTGPGRGLREVLTRVTGVDRATLATWLRAHGVSPRALPKDLTADQWTALWHLVGTGGPRPRRAAGKPTRRRPAR
ncbi:23S ribosomal RNA methyltransferase Erm [Saccharomonospora saliphila]|uniref:23S ribosomal RNA methyltransferase Erm n=1 Tax=Saccharomonospora saliphila TaxID=369829 RepID=UPI000373DFB3|nr:23S ribosomal RNA methyltransferase Erm [Saccharomonospora saliphila]